MTIWIIPSFSGINALGCFRPTQHLSLVQNALILSHSSALRVLPVVDLSPRGLSGSRGVESHPDERDMQNRINQPTPIALSAIKLLTDVFHLIFCWVLRRMSSAGPEVLSTGWSWLARLVARSFRSLSLQKPCYERYLFREAL